MPRFALPGQPQHGILHGNNREVVFGALPDYRFYLEKLQAAADEHPCEIHACLLMTNHVHLLLTPHTKDGIGKLMQTPGRYYAQYYNHCYQRTGTVWEGSYKFKRQIESQLLRPVAWRGRWGDRKSENYRHHIKPIESDPIEVIEFSEGLNMECLMDHIVLNMEDDEKMIAFYSKILMFVPERLEEYVAGNVPFPSVRLNSNTIIDLFPKKMWQKNAQAEQGSENLNHFCIALSKGAWQELLERLKANNVNIQEGPVPRWGAHGTGTSIYFQDPEGNLIEARYYEDKDNAEKCLLGS